MGLALPPLDTVVTPPSEGWLDRLADLIFGKPSGRPTDLAPGDPGWAADYTTQYFPSETYQPPHDVGGQLVPYVSRPSVAPPTNKTALREAERQAASEAATYRYDIAAQYNGILKTTQQNPVVVAGAPPAQVTYPALIPPAPLVSGIAPAGGGGFGIGELFTTIGNGLMTAGNAVGGAVSGAGSAIVEATNDPRIALLKLVTPYSETSPYTKEDGGPVMPKLPPPVAANPGTKYGDSQAERNAAEAARVALTADHTSEGSGNYGTGSGATTYYADPAAYWKGDNGKGRWWNGSEYVSL